VVTFKKSSIIFILLPLSIIVFTLCRVTAANDKPAASSPITAAWQGLATKFNPASEPKSFMEKQLSERAIENIVTPNQKSIMIADYSGLHSGNPYLLCRFHCDGTATSLQVTWKGNGTQPFIGNAPAVTIYLYNVEKRKFQEIVKETWKDKKAKAIDKTAETRIDGAESYVDERNDIYLLTVGPWGGGDSNSALSIDYVGLKAW
jgi:hypothetical protein